jgi:hypothetical protein
MPRGSALDGWKPSEWDDDSIEGLVPLVSTNTTVTFGLFGATLAAVAGRGSPKGLLVGASAGVVAAMIVHVATGRR